jgi:hypothetical protein
VCRAPSNTHPKGLAGLGEEGGVNVRGGGGRVDIAKLYMFAHARLHRACMVPLNPPCPPPNTHKGAWGRRVR